MLTVYHGSTLCVEYPLVSVGRNNLDFGSGFYITRLRQQAERWGRQLKILRNASEAFVNIYEFDMDRALEMEYKLLSFETYNRQWLDFIAASRKGEKPWLEYDIIEGGVANDKVINTVEGYLNGDFSAEVALGRLSYAEVNNQIVLLKQGLIDDCLHYIDSEVLVDSIKKGGTL